MRLSFLVYRLIVPTLLAGSLSQALAQEPVSTVETFGGGYSDLKPQQKLLVDDWFRRLSTVVQKPVDPVTGYDNLPLSTKTTFGAVTHALLMTRMTDETGQNIEESAIDLIDKVDRVAGEILGTRGDQQYRIYAQMKPGVLERLTQSTQFERSADNSVYHKGYPLSFRSAEGTPSIQISLARDATLADIDVDYRSSKIPAALFNGHLTAANSDVRARGNDQRHINHWAGLENWWSNVLGLRFSRTNDRPKIEGQAIAEVPRLKTSKASEAIYDFLSSWFVEQRPNEAIGYFAEDAYACLETEEGTKADRGAAVFTILRAMESANQELGKIASLSDAIFGVRLMSERVKAIKQPHAEFMLYDVREDLAEEFKCINQLDSTRISRKAATSKAFGKYVGATFTINRKDRNTVIATLWQSESGYWQLISYDVDPEIDRSEVPDVGPPRPATAALEYVEGDKEMVKAASDFLKEWFVKKDVDKAVTYMAPESLSCVNLYRADDDPLATTPTETLDLLKKGMTAAAEAIGPVKSLPEAINAPPVDDPNLKLVKHRDDKAFVIASLPGSMGTAADCNRRKPNGNPDFSATQSSGYGEYYATAFSLNVGKTEPGVLWTVWTKASSSWKVRSYVLLVP